MIILPPEARQLARPPHFAVLSVLAGASTPASYVMWIDHDEDALLLNTTIGQAKTRGLAPTAKVSVLLLDRDSDYHYVEVRGRVIGHVDGPPAGRHFEDLAHRYSGQRIASPPSNRRQYRIGADYFREHGRAATPPLGTPLILTVGRDRAYLEALNDAARRRGHNVVGAASEDQVIAALGDTRVRAVVLGGALPTERRELYERLIQLHRPDLPIYRHDLRRGEAAFADLISRAEREATVAG